MSQKVAVTVCTSTRLSGPVSVKNVNLHPMCELHERVQRGEQGVRAPLENHKNIGSLSITGLDPIKHHIATKPAFNEGPASARQLNAI